MFFVMALAGMVCVALCSSGQFITDLKAGYWIGSTPAAQQKVKFIAVVASALTAGFTIILLAKAFQFGEAMPGDPRQVLVAPPGLRSESRGLRIHEWPTGSLHLVRPGRHGHSGA